MLIEFDAITNICIGTGIIFSITIFILFYFSGEKSLKYFLFGLFTSIMAGFFGLFIAYALLNWTIGDLVVIVEKGNGNDNVYYTCYYLYGNTEIKIDDDISINTKELTHSNNSANSFTSNINDFNSLIINKTNTKLILAEVKYGKSLSNTEGIKISDIVPENSYLATKTIIEYFFQSSPPNSISSRRGFERRYWLTTSNLIDGYMSIK